MSKIASNEKYAGNLLRKAIDYFCHCSKAPDHVARIEKGDKAFGASEFFPAIKWLKDVNDDLYDPAKHHVVSNGSCTTNCLAPVAKVMLDTFGIVNAFMTTIHSYTNDQNLLDLPHRKGDLRRARAAAVNMVPTSTGAAKAIAEVIPALKGKCHGTAMRVPTVDVSVVDLTVITEKPVTVESINSAMKAAAESGRLKGVLQYVEEELVSCDFIGNPYSSCFDSTQTLTMGDNFAKIFSWYDNEWGFSCRMIDLMRLMAKKG